MTVLKLSHDIAGGRRNNGCMTGTSFDLTILEYELARHGLTTLTDRLGRAPGPAIDPLVLDRALDAIARHLDRLRLAAA